MSGLRFPQKHQITWKLIVGKAAKTKEQIGARIEDREITIKEDLAEEPVAEEVKEEATVKAEEKVSEEVADKKAE